MDFSKPIFNPKPVRKKIRHEKIICKALPNTWGSNNVLNESKFDFKAELLKLTKYRDKIAKKCNFLDPVKLIEHALAIMLLYIGHASIA